MHIKIGSTSYTVIDREDLHDNHKTLYGWIRFGKSEILIDAELAPQMRYIVLWHEIAHGILHNAGIEDHDEKMICVLGHGIVQVLRDNPELLTLLGTLKDAQPSTT